MNNEKGIDIILLYGNIEIKGGFIMWNLFKKSFFILPEDSSHYPSSKEIYDAITSYCAKNKQECDFVESPLTFKMNGILYRTIVFSSRMGYLLKCKQLN